MAFNALLLFVLPAFLLLSTTVASNEVGEKIEVKAVAPVKPPTLAPPYRPPVPAPPIKATTPPYKPPSPHQHPQLHNISPHLHHQHPQPKPQPPRISPQLLHQHHQPKLQLPRISPQPKPQLLRLQLNPLHHHTSHQQLQQHRRLHLLTSHQVLHCHQLGQERIASHYVERGVNCIQGLNCA
ncbi:alpha/beta-gliadin A-III-like [Hibiscus syriacus]|uniref:alpha/beta-gliadin A-III-like n=1 Tax=Hibiscus syriacus TaxID=106335 RepID=UPI001922DE0E|nr:alpha/beta-gliadin A-III-like [Hibiscus syriacus]